MRFLKHINESDNYRDILDNIIDSISNDCSDFINEIYGSNNFIYRGTDVYTNNITKIKSRKDRRPANTSVAMHEFLDDLFLKIHGWRARTQGVFTTSDLKNAKFFGKPKLFFPFNGYKYLWNMSYSDSIELVSDYEYIFNDNAMEDELRYYNEIHKHKNIIDVDDIRDEGKKFVEDIIKEYNKSNLQKAIYYKKEIIFKCKYYYLVDLRYEVPLKNTFLKG